MLLSLWLKLAEGLSWPSQNEQDAKQKEPFDRQPEKDPDSSRSHCTSPNKRDTRRSRHCALSDLNLQRSGWKALNHPSSTPKAQQNGSCSMRSPARPFRP